MIRVKFGDLRSNTSLPPLRRRGAVRRLHVYDITQLILMRKRDASPFTPANRLSMHKTQGLTAGLMLFPQLNSQSPEPSREKTLALPAQSLPFSLRANTNPLSAAPQHASSSSVSCGNRLTAGTMESPGCLHWGESDDFSGGLSG